MKRYDVEFKIGDLWLCVEKLERYGGAVMVAVRKTKIIGKKEKLPLKRPGPRLLLDYKKRHEVIALAFDLLGIAQKMLPEVTFNNSQWHYAPGQDRQPQSEAFRFTCELVKKTMEESAHRWRKLNDRIHILQLAARVLEDCDEDVATTIGSLLFLAERQGVLPITASFHASPIDEPHSETCN